MLRRLRPVVAVLAVVLALAGTVGGAGAQEPPPTDDPTVTTAPIAPPRASIVVDVDSGEVVSAANEREAVPPASTTKILTAVLAAQRLGLDAEIVVPPEVLYASPRRLQLRPGETWRVEDLVYAAMLCSCNDAAWALGQMAGGGSMDGFAGAASELAVQLGLTDGPVVRDPAGLDGPVSIGGGNLLSARDLAVVARAYLADPELAAIAAAPAHEWVGGDGKPHSVRNLNQFLDRYPGSFGLKTGSTARAGLTFVAAAERDGRRLLAVVLGSQNHYADARALLDAGFLRLAAGEATEEVLPPVPQALGGQPAPTTTTTAPPAPSTSPADGAGGEGEVAAPEDGILRSQPVPAVPMDDPAGDRARQVVWGAIGFALALVVFALALTARRRLRRSPS